MKQKNTRSSGKTLGVALLNTIC